MGKTAMDRFLDKVFHEPNTGCWLWSGAYSCRGYGFFCLGKTMSAHRASYIMHKGPITNGFHIRHMCDNKLCVNPNHLVEGTHQENMDDRDRSGLTVTGERHGKMKFTDAVVEQVRMDYIASKSYAKTGKKFGMSKTQVGNIIRGEQRAA